MGGNIEVSRGVNNLEERGCGNDLFEEVEGSLTMFVPCKRLVLASELVEGVGDFGKVADEGAVVVGKTEEGTKLQQGRRWGKLDKGGDLRGVHADTINGYNVAKVFYSCGNKSAFAVLGVALLVFEDREDLECVEGDSKVNRDRGVIAGGRETDFAGTSVGDEVAGDEVAGDEVVGNSDVKESPKLECGRTYGGGDEFELESGGVDGGGGDREESERVSGSTRGAVNLSSEGNFICGDVVKEAWTGGGGTPDGAEKAIVLKGTGEEVGEGHGWLVGEGGCDSLAADPLEAGNEDIIADLVVGNVLVEGTNILDEAVGGAVYAKPAKLVDVVVDWLLWAEAAEVAAVDEVIVAAAAEVAAADEAAVASAVLCEVLV
ncbi:hypothetical protein CBR_g53752 [Chara braunii]|uniref:Uncharacterized protein n=1 Tax=Chara braunii TaxID=69332 RepID=A0A388MB99_CHABU|nr:hypothetical protein CBR_g53752 [Chara braunii]|eukprot:GBG91861.1 hypothetical protein CBR_g53752 [Chara braunii]